MFKAFIFSIILLSTFITSSFAANEPPVQPNEADTNSLFQKCNYPDSVCEVFDHVYHFHNYVISITNIRSTKQLPCQAYILITNARDTIYRRYFPEIESLGGCAGVYSDDSNHFSDYFFISKFGDYDGRLLILSAHGKVLDINGSSFYISKKHDFIFADQNSDIGGLTIYSLKEKKVLYDSEKYFNKGDYTLGERYLSEIRFDANYYYLIYLTDEADKNKPQQWVLKFDNIRKAFTHDMINKIYLQRLDTLSLYNSPTDGNENINCYCGHPGMH